MEINLHGCTSIEMEEKSFDNFSVITVTIERENKEEVELQLFHAKDKNILFDFLYQASFEKYSHPMLLYTHYPSSQD